LLLNNIDSLVDFGKKFIHSLDLFIPLVPDLFEGLGLNLFGFIHETELAAADSMAALDFLEASGWFL
jgi:hypothetical protein